MEGWLAVAAAVAGAILTWIAHNKLDAFGWVGVGAIMLDPWVQWRAQAVTLMHWMF